MERNIGVTALLGIGMALCFTGQGFAYHLERVYTGHDSVIQRTAGMVRDPQANGLADDYGLRIMDLTWEDTGRYKGSSVGPNISDMTIQVQEKDPRTGSYRLTCMPVIRHPNFSDRTGDVPLDKFFILAGNEKGRGLRRVTLREYLGNFRSYLHDPSSWEGGHTSLLAPRDTHVLVSGQACFLPISDDGKAEFNPVLFNYQSSSNNPAVLAILVTREGTSATIIDNAHDGFWEGRRWGQRLFFNKDGERASLTGERISDFKAGPDGAGLRSGQEKGLNMVMLIQVPLKQRRPARAYYENSASLECALSAPTQVSWRAKSDVENAVIGHGEVEGPFTEIGGLDIERDPAFPIRVTVQFYKATSNGVVSRGDMREISEQIEKVYSHAEYTGSLVVEGDTGRPTEYTWSECTPFGWWAGYWNHRRHTPAPSWGIEDDSDDPALLE